MQRNGAACLSVLTDRQFFQGGLEILQAVRQQVHVPVLRKDFILDPYQVLEARAAGADAVLLIAECLEDGELPRLLDAIGTLEMAALVEFYEPRHLERILAAGATLIGINNRDLRTFVTDLGIRSVCGRRFPPIVSWWVRAAFTRGTTCCDSNGPTSRPCWWARA